MKTKSLDKFIIFKGRSFYFWQNKKNRFCDLKGLCATLEILRVKKMFLEILGLKRHFCEVEGLKCNFRVEKAFAFVSTYAWNYAKYFPLIPDSILKPFLNGLINDFGTTQSYILASSHALRTCDEAFLFIWI